MTGFQTAMETQLQADSVGYNGFTLVCRALVEQLASINGDAIRITVVSGSAEGLKIAKSYVGYAAAAGDAYDFSATPTQITWDGGSTTKTISVGTSAVSDSTAFVLDPTKNILFSFYFDSASNDDTKYLNVPVGLQSWYRAGDEAATVNKTTGYTTDAGYYALQKVEVLNAIPSTGWKLPTSDTAVSGTWSNPTNVQAGPNGSSAQTTIAVASTTASRDAGGFGFSTSVLPDGATITRVMVRVAWAVSTTASIATLRLNGKVTSTVLANHDSTSEPTAVNPFQMYDITADRAWVPADFRDGTFFIRFSAVQGGSATSCTYSYDVIGVNVSYTLGPLSKGGVLAVGGPLIKGRLTP